MASIWGMNVLKLSEDSKHNKYKNANTLHLYF